MTPDEARVLLDPATVDTHPQGILAAADIREQTIRAAATVTTLSHPLRNIVPREWQLHIAAEADPAHALAAVRHWRGVADRHGKPLHFCVAGQHRWVSVTERGYVSKPCAELTEVADEARAYLGET